MAKKQTKTNIEKKIIEAYVAHVLANGSTPENVFLFTEELGIRESDFYKHFGSFKAVEERIIKSFFENTNAVLKKSADYSEFDAHNKLLSFYYTFFEVLKANRSFITTLLSGQKQVLSSFGVVKNMRVDFFKYLDSLDLSSPGIKIEKLEELRAKGIKEFFWGQFLVILKFWLDDSSANFEKSDIFIEKTVKATFELMNTAPIQSVVDWAKFFYKEKINAVA